MNIINDFKREKEYGYLQLNVSSETICFDAQINDMSGKFKSTVTENYKALHQ